MKTIDNEKYTKDEKLMKIFDDEYNKLSETCREYKNIKYLSKNRKFYKLYIDTICNLTFDMMSFKTIQKVAYKLFNQFNWVGNACGIYLELIFNVLVETAKCKEYKNEDKEAILDCIEDISTYIKSSVNGKYEKFCDENYNPYSFVISSSKGVIKSSNEATIRTICIKNNTKFMRDLIHECTQNKERKHNKLFVVNQGRMLEIIFNHFPVKHFSSLDSFNDKTFLEQCNYLNEWFKSNDVSERALSIIFVSFIDFYVFIQNKMDEKTYEKNFCIYDAIALKYEYLSRYLKKGVKVYNYNIYDAPPFEDDFLLKPQKMALHQNGQDTIIKYIDFTCINNQHIRQIVKEMFWFDTSHVITARKKTYSFLTDILNDFFDGQYGEISENHIPPVTLAMIIEIKSNYANESEARYETRMFMLNYFLRYIERELNVEIDKAALALLKMNTRTKNAYKESYTRKELQDIIDAFKEESDNASEDKKTEYYLYYILMNIFIINSMRISSIINLKVDSLKMLLDSDNEQGKEYALKVSTKTSGTKEKVINISPKTKKFFDMALEATKEIRKSAKNADKEYLFIYKQRNFNIISRISKSVIAQYFQKICEKYNIRYLTFAGIRNSYMQSISEHLYKKSENEKNNIKYIEALSGHRADVHWASYDKVDIREFCQTFYNTEIGDVELSGSIGDKEKEIKERTVEQGAGYCDSGECMVAGNLRCLLCKKFVTTVNCIPDFEYMVQEIDKKIENEKIQHEKELLFNIKKVCVCYLEKLYERKRILNGQA